MTMDTSGIAPGPQIQPNVRLIYSCLPRDAAMTARATKPAKGLGLEAALALRFGLTKKAEAARKSQRKTNARKRALSPSPKAPRVPAASKKPCRGSEDLGRSNDLQEDAVETAEVDVGAADESDVQHLARHNTAEKAQNCARCKRLC